MRRQRALAAVVLAAAAALVLAAASAGGRAAGPSAVRIEFTGKGGGRYLDVTRWLRDDTRECYARRTADETVSVSWNLSWRASIVRTPTGFALRNPSRLPGTIAGGVKGKTVRDACDGDATASELDPSWVGSDRCVGPLPVRTRGGLGVTGRHGRELAFRGPVFGSAPHPCELFVRNDQLAAHVPLSPAALRSLAAGKALTVPVGTEHPRPGDHFLGRRTCSAFPHIYEGVVYLYDCDDTLIWSGTVTLRPA
jgi:hypothetical protein